MKARDVMVSPVISVKPSCTVKEVAKTLLERRISAVPVVDDAGKLVGIVSEGDLMAPGGDRDPAATLLVAARAYRRRCARRRVHQGACSHGCRRDDA